MLQTLNIKLKTRIPRKGKAIAAKKEPYFNERVQDAIIAYNEESDPVKRNIIYNKDIQYALDKLAENLIHTYKFYYHSNEGMAAAKHDVVTYLLEKLPRYEKSKGKAFSYFDRIALNYLIISNKAKYKKVVQTRGLEILETDQYAGLIAEDKDTLTTSATNEFFKYFITYLEDNFDKIFKKDIEKHVSAAFIEIYKKIDNFEVFNKKAMYVMIKEYTHTVQPPISTIQITKVLDLIRTKYNILFNDYYQYGYIRNVHKKQ